jgi:D-alanyl-D-alanine carboxypeptidase
MTSAIRLTGLYPGYPGPIAPQTRQAPTINSEFACAVDIDNGWVLYTKNHMAGYIYPASTVKLMTALLIAELKAGVLDSETVTWQTSDDLAAGFSQVPLTNGDVVTWRDLLHGILLVSGGDAAQAAARVLGNENASRAITSTDGYADFVAMMNARADQLGNFKSAFVDSHGAGAVIFCARDAAVVFGECMKNAVIQSVMANTSYNINVTGANARTIALTNGNVLLGDEGVIGAKTGTYIISGLVDTSNMATLWQAPSGDRVAIFTMNASSSANRLADQRAIIAQLATDFPYLDPFVYQVFTASGTFNVPAGVSSVDVLLVGGGGGGGSRQGGGGGAGGVRVATGVSVTPGGTVTVTVGAGGAGGTSGGRGTNGGTTSFGAESVVGGGGGGGRTTNNAGASGGSGGGGANSVAGGAGTSGQGFAGGGSSWEALGGGGGGASEVGVTTVGTTGVNGGDGGDGVTLASLGFGAAVGAPAAVGGGGGGAAVDGNGATARSAGGVGGGGSGAYAAGDPNGQSGTANTGGGGGACRAATDVAGAGGSGLVVVKYIA